MALEPWRGVGLTLGNEIDKLASNIALGRDAAGVHYRSDSIRGLFVGEQQALWLLRDYSRTYNERFDGFVVRAIRKKFSVPRGPAHRPLRWRHRMALTEFARKPSGGSFINDP